MASGWEISETGDSSSSQEERGVMWGECLSRSTAQPVLDMVEVRVENIEVKIPSALIPPCHLTCHPHPSRTFLFWNFCHRLLP